MSDAKITIDVVESAWNNFTEFKNHAEQHDFPLLLRIDLELVPLYDDLKDNWNPRHAKTFLKALAMVGKHFGFFVPEVVE